jgi:hypothetical protein
LDYDKAIVAFTKIIEINPRSQRAYIGLAEAYIGKGETDEAIDMLRVGLKELPGRKAIKDMLEALTEPEDVLEIPTTASTPPATPPTTTPASTIDLSAIDKSQLTEFIRQFVFAPEMGFAVSTDRDYILCVLSSLKSTDGIIYKDAGGYDAPVEVVMEKLLDIYGITTVNHEAYGWFDGLSEPAGYAEEGYRNGFYSYWWGDGSHYQSIVTVNAITDNGDGTFNAVVDVIYGSPDFDDSYDDYMTTYSGLNIILRPYKDSFTIVNIDGREMPDGLFTDYVEPSPAPDNTNQYTTQMKEFERQIVDGEWDWLAWASSSELRTVSK